MSDTHHLYSSPTSDWSSDQEEEKKSLDFLDLKMMIRGSFRHDLEHVVKSNLEQNSNTGVFSLGYFLQQAVQQGQDVFRKIRQQNTAKYFLYPGAYLALIAEQGLFMRNPKITLRLFCESGVRGGCERGIRG